MEVPHSTALLPSALSVAAWIKTPLERAEEIHVIKGGGWARPGWSTTNWFGGMIRFVLHDGVGSETVLDSAGTIQAGVWNHVVRTWDGSKMKQYINGVKDANERDYTKAMGTNKINLRIGCDDNNRLPFKGVIDEVRVYNRALTAAEIKRHYESELIIARA